MKVNHDLEMSVERETAETPTLDALTRPDHSGDLKSKSEHYIGLPSSPGCKGSTAVDTEDRKTSL